MSCNTDDGLGGAASAGSGLVAALGRSVVGLRGARCLDREADGSGLGPHRLAATRT